MTKFPRYLRKRMKQKKSALEHYPPETDTLRLLSDEEIEFLCNLSEEDDEDLEIVECAVTLVRSAKIESLCEIVLTPRAQYICALIGSYLNDNADRLGFIPSCAVEKMARVKRAPWAINQLALNDIELAWVQNMQKEIIQKTFEKSLKALSNDFPKR